MPFSREVKVSYEAEYTLPFSHLHAKFAAPTQGLLSPPNSLTQVEMVKFVLIPSLVY